MERMKPEDFKLWLEQRTKRFAVEVFRLLDGLPSSNSTRVIAYQLGKSASSIGANYHEANRAESKEDFIHKLAIALKEASESKYWLEVLFGLDNSNPVVEKLESECQEIRNLLQSIRSSVSRKRNLPGPTIPQSDNPPIGQSPNLTIRQSDNQTIRLFPQ